MNLSAQQIKAAIPKLEQRLRELKEVNFDNPGANATSRLNSLYRKVDGTLVEIFGADSLDYKSHWVTPFWHFAPMHMGRTYSEHEKASDYQEAVSEAISKIETALEILRKQLEDMGAVRFGSARQVYQGLDLHPEIDRAASALYRGGHYADAIEDTVKALNAIVRLRSGVKDTDGSKLMQRVFSPEKPVLRFNMMADPSDVDEQWGYMMMFSGAVALAHKLVQDDRTRALEFIAFVSLLAKLLDDAEKVAPP